MESLNLDNQSMNRWRDELELPFTGIRQAKSRLRQFNARYERLNEEARLLIDEVSGVFKGKTSPIYLHRSANTAAKNMKWRLSAAKIYGFSSAAKSYSLLTVEVLNVLRSADIDEETIVKIVEYDFKRINLNYALSFFYAEKNRLQAFVDEFEAWRKLPGLVKSI